MKRQVRWWIKGLIVLVLLLAAAFAPFLEHPPSGSFGGPAITASLPHAVLVQHFQRNGLLLVLVFFAVGFFSGSPRLHFRAAIRKADLWDETVAKLSKKELLLPVKFTSTFVDLPV